MRKRKPIRKGLWLLLLFSFLLAACDGLDPEQRRIALHLPPSDYKADAGKGRVAFRQYCASCHGQAGRGTLQGPPLVHETYRPSHHADFAFHMAVRDGVRAHHWKFGDMKPLSGVTPEATEDIIAYVRALQRNAGIR